MKGNGPIGNRLFFFSAGPRGETLKFGNGGYQKGPATLLSATSLIFLLYYLLAELELI